MAGIEDISIVLLRGFGSVGQPNALIDGRLPGSESPPASALARAIRLAPPMAERIVSYRYCCTVYEDAGFEERSVAFAVASQVSKAGAACPATTCESWGRGSRGPWLPRIYTLKIPARRIAHLSTRISNR